MNHGISHKLKVNFRIHQLLFFRENWKCGEESTSLPFSPTGLWCQPPSSSLSLPHLWVPSFSLFLCWWLRVLCVFSIRWFDSVIMLHSLSHNHPCFDKRTSSSQSLKTEVIIFPSIYITSTVIPDLNTNSHSLKFIAEFAILIPQKEHQTANSSDLNTHFLWLSASDLKVWHLPGEWPTSQHLFWFKHSHPGLQPFLLTDSARQWLVVPEPCRKRYRWETLNASIL